jgi:anti-sigma factor ChrR (cupin superfamily)
VNANAGDTPHDDLLALYAAGALAPDEATEAECAGGDVEAWELYADAVALMDAAEPVAPPPQLKSALLAKLDPPAGYTISPADPTAFERLPFPGLSMRVLNIDKVGGRFTSLLRFAPGARLPAHPHASAEECVLLEGSLYMGGVKMTAGAYLRVEAGVDHVEQWSDTGALAFVTGPLELLEHDDR